MAINLTTSWQNVANSTWAPGTGFSVTFYLDAKYSSQNQENNNTTIQTRLRSVVNAGSGSGYNYSFTCSYANTVSGSGLWTLENETITSGETTITHNNDGTKTLNISATAKITGISLNISINGDITLPSIARYPILTSAPNFNDEENPTIYYTTSLGFSGATVYGAIYSTSNVAYAYYRPVVVANGSYTFNLTTEERNRLRNASANSNELDVVFYLTTDTGQTQYYSSLQRKLRIVNANPTFTYTTTETNNKIIALLGSSASSVVQNASVVTVATTPSAKKGATIDAVIVSSEGFRNTDTTSPYSVNVPIKGNTIRIVVGDSRGNTSETLITKTLIPYQPMSILNLSFERTNPTSSNVLINLEATYYQQTFGSTANVPIVEWKLDNGSYTTIPSTNYTINNTNHKLTITNYELTNILNYQNSGTFTIKISDKLTGTLDSRFVTKGIPTFELGEHDAKVNGDLEVTGNLVANGYEISKLIEQINNIPSEKLRTTDDVDNLYDNLGIKVYSIWAELPISMPAGVYAYGTLICITQSTTSSFLNSQIYITDGVYDATSGGSANRGIYVRTSTQNWLRLTGTTVFKTTS